MPKKYFRRIMPDPQTVRDHPSLQKLERWLGEPNLWHLNRHSVSRGCAAGVFAGFIIPFGQMLLAAIIAIFTRGNLPLAAAFTWITNPFTYAPVYYFCYKVGEWVLGREATEYRLDWTLDALLNDLGALTGPFFVGSTICATVAATIVFWSIQGIWRLHIVMKLSQRKTRQNQHRS